jgi:hypothetical protein
MDEERNVQKYVVSNEEYRNQLLELGINYVVAGDITKLGRQNLLVISIIDLGKLVQIAGDVQIFGNKREIEGKLPGMARNIIDGAKIDWTNKPMLAVVNPRLSDNADPAAANVLGEILGIEITRTGKYAVYPRNTTLEAVQTEWDNQHRGTTAVADPQGPGRADKPGQVLSVIARGGEGSVTTTRFNASIISLDTGEQVSFTSQTYQNIESGIAVMRTIAKELTITDAERRDLSAAEKRARDEAAAAEARARDEATVRTMLLSAKERLDGINGETRGQFAADYRKAETAYFQGERAFGEGKYEAVQQSIANMDAALNALAKKQQAAAKSTMAWKNFLGDDRRFFSIGAQVGTWFTAPWVVLSPRLTFSIFPYTFFDIACDAGILHGYEQKVDYDSKYFSLYPSAHFNFFVPFDISIKRDEFWFGWYIGAGAGWLYAYYGGDADASTVSLWAFDATSGVHFGVGHHYFNIAYTFRTDIRMDFDRINHKASVGYTFRFN